jgi:hypothetical protein
MQGQQHTCHGGGKTGVLQHFGLWRLARVIIDPSSGFFLTIICINDLISLTHSGIWLLPNSLTCFIHCLAKLSLSVTYGRLVAFYRYSPVSSINKTDRTHVRYNPNVVENTNKNIRKVWTYCTYSSPGQSGNPRSRHHNTKLKYVATF